MSNVHVISHFSTTGEKERRQTFNDLARTMVKGLLRSRQNKPKNARTVTSGAK